MTGQTIMFIGIGLLAISIILYIVTDVLFRVNKKKMITKIYEDIED